MYKDSNLKISLGIVALNEEDYLPDLLLDIQNQTFNKKDIELVFVDSGSNDNTMSIFNDYKHKFENEYYSIQILNNVKKKQASGWNVAISNFKGDALIRVDAHARIPKDFIEKNVFYLSKGEDVVGGVRTVQNKISSPWNNTLLLAELSLFGSSIASYRRANTEKYVNSMFHACYRREVLEKVGLFNENLGRTEDNEFHYRIRKNGYKLYYNSEINSSQLIRSSLKKMIQQKYSNGYWIGITTFICPNCLSIYHYVPFVFVISLFLSLILMILKVTFPIYLLIGSYCMFDILNTILCIKDKKFNYTSWMLLLIFPFLHISYGVGTLIGGLKKFGI